ncbi:succinate dehydrogenase, hydrophobic membrane anchor protein [Hyphococcus sp.]|jgi:succinate dehydrogenase / fumarate reductase membrane anchor subunit|uniref:succinate dehydrogenase, hydrophobic membrane anchor protein n=1 Tax=Hyphococcus sp. TaxID=2038636 RepID=UPI003D13BF19
MAQHKGTSTFIIQRATAALMIPLVLWFLIGMVSHLGAGYEAARVWAAHPLNAGLLAALFVIGAIHMRIGMAEVIADYIHGGLKSVLNLINWLCALGLAAAALFAVYTLSFAG